MSDQATIEAWGWLLLTLGAMLGGGGCGVALGRLLNARRARK